MARQFTHEQVKRMFEAANFELLSSGYTSTKAPLAYRCNRCGHQSTTRLEYIRAGQSCPKCWEARRSKNLKHSFEFVRREFLAKNLELLDSAYTDSKTPLAYRCQKCGYKGQLRFSHLRAGAGCRQCGIRWRASQQRRNFPKFKNELFKRGIEVLSRNYVNALTKLDLRCAECGQSWQARANDLRNPASGCPRCGHKRGGQKHAYTNEVVARLLADRQITLLSTYQRSQKPIRVRFEQCGHTVWRTWNVIQHGVGCPKCAPNARPTREDYRALAARFSGEVLEIARTSNQQSKWRCSIGHVFRRPFISIKQLDTFCTVCSGSYAEMLCRAAVERLFGKPFRRKRVPGMKSPKGRPLELDIYNEELRIAIEHHGAHHYRALPHWDGVAGLDKQRIHDRVRREFCRVNGILLIEIEELGIRTSLEEMRQQIRDALLRGGRNISPAFDRTDLTRLPRLNASQVQWAELHEAAAKMGLEILTEVFQGSQIPITVRCKSGHITQKTPASILQDHRCDECYMEKTKKPLRLSDGRVFESGAAAAKVLGVRKETVNTAIRKNKAVKGFRPERISWDEFRRQGGEGGCGQ